MDPIDKGLLVKYIHGNCTPEEESMILQWLDDNDADAYPAVHSARKSESKAKDGWEKLTARFEELKPAFEEKKMSRKRWIWAAAVIATFVSLTVFTFREGWWVDYEARYQTGYGEIKRVSLADGTIVTLNARSVLEVKKGFGHNTRTVCLTGEAFFEINKHAGKPFEVQAGKVNVIALGTSFDVTNFSNDARVTVSLEQGKVAVKTQTKDAGKQIILKPGESAVYEERAAEPLKIEEKFDRKERLAWQRQIIYFKNAAMPEVIGKLERFYGVEIDTDALAGKRWSLSGEYKGETLENVLQSLSFNYGLEYKIIGKKIWLYEK